ncbi:AraC family transcriptional regulator [Mucilaginibacter dorajii]|uniref:AraC family transcriptional regulator n=1 Tax=Mucilaginibacter dorajii TaxID=692994 RepID=UPI002169E421|nr:AraC family transcriptional regulator [Mucilaginibacter dorajii]MCS3732445.1 AraC-like DNA-binding protein [Mucilaginibacter dorajii]
MMKTSLFEEIIPFATGECINVTMRGKDRFNSAVHFHEEIEINLIIGAAQSQRIIGDHIGASQDIELVLVGSNLPHTRLLHNCANDAVKEISLHFPKDLLSDKMLSRNQFFPVRKMLEQSPRGILFSETVAHGLSARINAMSAKKGFGGIIELFSILFTMATSTGMELLASYDLGHRILRSHKCARIGDVNYYLKNNFDKDIPLKTLAEIAQMSESGFSRFFKGGTGVTFKERLTEIRVGHATRILADTNDSISEIAYQCGFNNLSNFNRVFKQCRGCTPTEFRSTILKTVSLE